MAGYIDDNTVGFDQFSAYADDEIGFDRGEQPRYLTCITQRCKQARRHAATAHRRSAARNR